MPAPLRRPSAVDYSRSSPTPALPPAPVRLPRETVEHGGEVEPTHSDHPVVAIVAKFRTDGPAVIGATSSDRMF